MRRMAAAPRLLQELETPVPVVDLDRMAGNLDRMAAYATIHGLYLRPHIKTHKSPRLAAEQLHRGAVGLTCATTHEAEVMSEVCDDLLVAYPPIGELRLQRLMSLPRSVSLMVALDSATAVEALSQGAQLAGRRVGVCVELDMGMQRTGVPRIEDAVALARLVVDHPPLDYMGIAFYPGHIRESTREQDASLRALNVRLGETIRALERADLAPPVVSGGSTPTAWRSHEIAGLTEIRPGTYVFNDRATAEAGACEWEDCALTVLATVVSTAVPGQAVIDAGSKALGREPLRAGRDDSYGVLLEHPEVLVTRMSEEHGVLDLSDTGWQPEVGEQVRVVPNHVCVVVHLNDVVHGARNDMLETSWPVVARGRGWGSGSGSG